jgi:hypothetical protein
MEKGWLQETKEKKFNAIVYFFFGNSLFATSK